MFLFIQSKRDTQREQHQTRECSRRTTKGDVGTKRVLRETR